MGILQKTRSLQKALFLFLFPFLEYVLLRGALHRFFKIPIGWSGNFTDYDFLLPVPFAFILLMQFFQKEQPLKLQPQVPILVGNLFLLMSFLMSHFFFYPLREAMGESFMFFWWLCVICILGSAFFLFVSPRYYFKNPNRFLFLPCLAIACSLVFYQNGFEAIWDWVRTPLSQSVCRILGVIWGKSVSCEPIEERTGMLIRHPEFNVLISKGCGGLDSFLLFSISALVFFSFYRRFFKPLFWGPFFGVGFFLMYGLNVFRISFLFCLAILMKKISPSQTSFVLFTQIFHAHLGWFLYFWGIYQYFGLTLQWASRTKIKGRFSPRTKNHFQLPTT